MALHQSTSATFIIPEFACCELTNELDADLVSKARVERRLDRLAWVLDSVVPLPGGFRLGLDSIAGLIPGVGDISTALISTYMMVEGARANAPKSVMARMLGNVAVDAALGAVPFLGDLFDMGFRSNVRNVDLLRDYLDQPEQTGRTSVWFLILMVVVLIAIVIGSVIAMVALVKFIIGLF